MYSIDEIKSLISVLESSSLSVIELQKEDGSKIRIERPAQNAVYQMPVAPAMPMVQPATQAAPAVQSAPVAASAPAASDNLKSIDAPIVGVFYQAPAPDREPYMSVGKKVKKGDTVCIIEAMKCMNEIQSEVDGEIAEILVKDGELVEYGQPLFKVR